MLKAQFANEEGTTLEVFNNGTTSYITKVDGMWRSQDNNLTANEVMFSLEEGFIPLPYFNAQEASK